MDNSQLNSITYTNDLPLLNRYSLTYTDLRKKHVNASVRLKTKGVADAECRIVPILLLVVVPLSPVWAQSFNGSISGTVKDPSGGIVAGAELVLKNQAAGVELRRTATDKGEYAFRNLVPGSYEIRVTPPDSSRTSRRTSTST